MKKIVIFGAGRSSTSLIDYLLSIAEEQQIFITLLDYNEEFCLLYTSPSPRDKTPSRMPSSA